MSGVLDDNLDAVRHCKVDSFDRVDGGVDSDAVGRNSTLVARPDLGLLRSKGVEETRLTRALFPVESVIEWDISDLLEMRSRREERIEGGTSQLETSLLVRSLESVRVASLDSRAGCRVRFCSRVAHSGPRSNWDSSRRRELTSARPVRARWGQRRASSDQMTRWDAQRGRTM